MLRLAVPPACRAPCSASAGARPEAPQAADEWVAEYEGAYSRSIRTLKLVSLSTAVLSLIGSPTYLYLTLGPNMGIKTLGAVGFTCFGLFTTGLLHWFVSPYVHRLWYHPQSRAVKVQMMSVLAQPMYYEFPIDSIKAPDSIAALQTFEAAGRVMFVDDQTFENKELLNLLTPASPYDLDAQSKKPVKDDDDQGI